MMYALGDMDEIICLAGALLFTGKFGSGTLNISVSLRLTHVRGEVWIKQGIRDRHGKDR